MQLNPVSYWQYVISSTKNSAAHLLQRTTKGVFSPKIWTNFGEASERSEAEGLINHWTALLLQQECWALLNEQPSNNVWTFNGFAFEWKVTNHYFKMNILIGFFLTKGLFWFFKEMAWYTPCEAFR